MWILSDTVIELTRFEDQLPQSQTEAMQAGAAFRVRRPSGWALLRELISSQITTGELRGAVRLVWRAVRFPITTSRYMEALDRIRMRAGVETVPYRLARKFTQNFLHHSLPQAARINLLKTHYERLLAVMDSRFVGRILRQEVVVLAEIKARSTASYRLCLARNDQHFREGELIVSLVRKDDERQVASLSIVVGALYSGDPPDLWIGGLQGCNGVDSKAVTIQVTRDLWGLRPKDLLIHAGYALADIFGAANLKAISNAGHARHSLKRKKNVYTDYDAYWRELGGAPIAGGFFLLPKARHRRSVEDVRPAKRSAWRARCALVDEIAADIRRLAIRRNVG